MLIAAMLSGCAVRDMLDAKGIVEYKIDTEGSNYENGLVALQYDEDKLNVSTPFKVGNEIIFGVDVKSDKIITGDSQILIMADLNQSETEESIKDELDSFITQKMNIKDDEITNRLDNDVSYDRNYMIISSSFECKESRYEVKMMYKWNCLLTICAEYVDDKGNNEYIRNTYNSIRFIGTEARDIEEY